MQHHPINHKIDRIISWEGRQYLYFSGTAYLGMGSVPEFEERIITGLKKYGPNYGASRSGNIQLQVYGEVEQAFAQNAGVERAALLSSGFMAGYVCRTLLEQMVDEIWAAPDAHPAILPPNGPIGPSISFQEFVRACVEKSQKLKGRTIAILANTVDTLKPEVHDFGWVEQLSDANSYYLLLDDSHAFGVLGEGVFGTYPQWKKLPVRLVVTGSLGKALGLPAGIVLGDNDVVDKVMSSPLFVGASPPAPGYMEAFLKAESLFADQRQKLKDNMAFFFSQIKTYPHLHFQEDFPVATFSETGWASKLLEKGILISSMAYPYPQDTPVDRIVLSAYHQKEDLERLVEVIHIG